MFAMSNILYIRVREIILSIQKSKRIKVKEPKGKVEEI